MKNLNSRKFGFSLLELSIALVIIGLMVGTSLTAYDYFRFQSRMQKVITKTQEIASATQNFKDKYGLWPGDYGNFLENGSVVITGGNENGVIDLPATLSSVSGERVGGFKQLAYTNFFPGNFDTIVAPEGPDPNIFYYFGSRYIDFKPAVGAESAWNTRIILTLSQLQASGSNITTTGVGESATFLAKEMKYLDEKLDDGMPLTGNIQSVNLGTTLNTDNCVCVEDLGQSITCQNLDGQYNTNLTKNSCVLYFRFNDKIG